MIRTPVSNKRDGAILIHSGAAQEVRVWPIERYSELAKKLRASGRDIRIACDTSQVSDWQRLNETPLAPNDVDALFQLLDQTSAFIGNDSGPGHVAALCGVPTFTIFGPQLSASFSPIHPAAEWIDGKPCIYKPCFDSCHYPAPYCILNISEAEVISRVEAFLGDK
jgi:heptosyltransferase-2